MTGIGMVFKYFMKSLSTLSLKKHIFKTNTYCYMLVLKKSLMRASGLPEQHYFLSVGLPILLTEPQ